MIVTWLLANWSKVLIGIIALSLAGYIALLKYQVGSARLERDQAVFALDKSKEEIEEWKKIYSVLGDKLAEQNKKILILNEKKKEADKRRLAAEKKSEPMVRQAQDSENALRDVSVRNGTCEAQLEAIDNMVRAAK